MFLNTFGNCSNVKCGLLSFVSSPTWDREGRLEGDTVTGIVPVFLESVDVQATAIHSAAEIIVTQIYVNNQTEEADTFYYFPIQMKDAVTGFEVEINDMVIKNIVLREDKRRSYEEAIRNRKFSASPCDNLPDVYQTRVGLLKPNARATVTIAYVTELQLREEKIEIRIPNIIVPQFAPNEVMIPAENYEDNAEGINLSIPKAVSMPDVAYEPGKVKVNIDFLLEGEGCIASIECDPYVPSTIEIGQLPEKENWSTANVEYVGELNDMREDLVVHITASEILSPRMYLEETPDETVLMSTFCPLLTVPEPEQLNIIFAISPSSEKNITHTTQKALTEFLKALPPTASFNVVSSGPNFLFPNSTKIDDDSLEKVLMAVSEHEIDSTASLKGNLRSLVASILCDKTLEYPTQVVLFLQNKLEKDESDSLISLVQLRTQFSKARLFVIGVGNNFDLKFVQRLGEAGQGAGVLIRVGDANLQKTVKDIVDMCTVASLADVKLIWSDWVERISSENLCVNDSNSDVEVEIIEEVAGKTEKQPFLQIPETPPPIFSGSQFVTFGIFVNKYSPRVLDIQGISYQNLSESLEYNYRIQLNECRERHVGSFDTITKLAFSKALQQLEEKLQQLTDDGSRKTRFEAEKIKEQIMQIACREGIPSRLTVFATINADTGEEIRGHWTRQTRYATKNEHLHVPGHKSWGSGIPYGSIARNKLSSIRKTAVNVSEIPNKIQRANVSSTYPGNIIDLSGEDLGTETVFSRCDAEHDLITISD